MEYIKLTKEYIEPTGTYNIISCVVFRLPKSYKNESMYYKGLKVLIDIFRKIFTDFYLRIYYDDSVLNNKNITDPDFIKSTEINWRPIFETAKKNKYVQLCKYEMKDFKLDDYNHNGVIGTVVRMCPLLDLKENNNIKYVICTDIDAYFAEYKQIKEHLLKLKNSNREFFYRSKYCYFLQDRFRYVYNYYDKKIITNPILAGTIITHIKIPENILKSFFDCLLNNTKKGCEKYKSFQDFDFDSDLYKKKLIFEDKKIIKYGIDEILTLDILKYLLDNNIKILVYKVNDIEKITYKIYIDHKNKIVSDNRFNKLVKFILGTNYDKNKTCDENFILLDKILYTEKFKYKSYHEYVYLRIKKLFKILTERNQLKKYNFDDKDVLCANIIENDAKYFSL